MARLAEYLARLATVFGFQEHVHFLKVRKGSAVPEIHVQEATALKVHARLKLIGTADAPEDAAKSVQHINAMLREDNASAVLRVKGGAQVIQFPGCKTPLAEEAIVHEAGELVGTVIKVGGKDETVPLMLQDTDGTTFSCTTTRAMAENWLIIFLGTWFVCKVPENGDVRQSAYGNLMISALKAGKR